MSDREEGLVFADADGTLLRINSLFDLLLFDAAAHDRLPEATRFLAELRALRTAGAPRARTNRRYFTWWAGRAVGDVRESARAWADALEARPPDEVFHEAVLQHALARARDGLVVLSASFRPALEPLARRLPGVRLICTRPVVAGGLYTGEVESPLLGAEKARAVEIALDGRDPRRCWGYGDHATDAEFMALVGGRVVVAERGADLGWALESFPSFTVLRATSAAIATSSDGSTFGAGSTFSARSTFSTGPAVEPAVSVAVGREG